MNVHQRRESKEFHYLIKVWWMAKNEPYKKFRRYMRKLRRDVRGNKK